MNTYTKTELLEIAKWQKRLLLFFLGMILAGFVLIALFGPASKLGSWVGLPLSIGFVWCIYKLGTALRFPAWATWAAVLASAVGTILRLVGTEPPVYTEETPPPPPLSMLAGLAFLVITIVMVVWATKALRSAGLKVGLLGAKAADIHKLAGETAAVQPPPLRPATGSTADVQDIDQQLRKLAKLKEDGIVSEEEFNQKKKALLGI